MYISEIDFDNPKSLSDTQFYNITGLEKSQFEHLIAICEENPENRKKKSLQNSMGLLLTKLRVGLSLNEMHGFFGQDRSTISKAISRARSILTDDFVPRYLGIHEIFIP